MKRDISKFKNGRYDLLVIGGGINGAAVANLAAYHGIKVALFEKGDFASGTSSKSTKLLHGGLRYLEHLDFGLVKESLKERGIQLNSAPHLVKPLKFVIPVYKTDTRPLWMMHLGVSLYDFFSGDYSIGQGRKLSRDEVIYLMPGIKQEDLVGGVIYFDVQMNDSRLVIENVLSADKYGAHVANYVEVRDLIKENGKTVEIEAVDLLEQTKFRMRADHIVCAVGPWTNIFRQKERNQAPPKVRTTKGVHIVYRGEIARQAVFIQIPKDNRMFFILPFYGNSLIGTTDTDYSDRPENVTVEDVDIDYLFKEANRVFPKEKFAREKIISTFAGLRPLVFKQGSPSKLSRNHVIEESYTGITYIMGGKYTTYRKIAMDCLAKVYSSRSFEDLNPFPLYGGGLLEQTAEDLAAQYGLSVKIVENLIGTYGTRALDVLKLTEKDPALKTPIQNYPQIIEAQFAYSKQVEMAQTEQDITSRRLSLQYLDNKALL